MKRSLLVRQIFATCRLRHAHLRKDTSPPRFIILKATESWAEPGNEATIRAQVAVWQDPSLRQLLKVAKKDKKAAIRSKSGYFIPQYHIVN